MEDQFKSSIAGKIIISEGDNRTGKEQEIIIKANYPTPPQKEENTWIKLN